MRTVLAPIAALFCLVACDHYIEVRLTPQSDGLLDGLQGELRVYAASPSFECPGNASPRWPDRCTDAALEPLVRAPALAVTGGAALIREIAVAGSMPAQAVGELEPARYAFVYVGTRDGCDVVAVGCTVVDFPADVRIDVAPPVASSPGATCLTGCGAARDASGCAPCTTP